MARVQAPRAEIVAHRGASAYAPENTFAAFDLALAQGADVLELDVRPAADGHLVLVHDPTLERIAGDARAVAGLSRAAIARLSAATRPAAFEEFLERYARTASLLIDLKDPAPLWEEHVVDAIERHRLRGRVAVQSFDHEALRRVRTAAPWLPLAPLVPGDGEPLDVLDAAAELAGGIGIRHDAVDVEVARAVREAGVVLRAWTVDDPVEIRRLLALGVDAIVTNAPDVALAAVRPHAA
jgi:glycerophosphoryl diester phosphodiesterase